MMLLDALLIAATLLNLYAWLQHERARRRFRAQRELFTRLCLFAGWLSRTESGSPPHVQAAARRALGTDVQVDVMYDDGTVH